MMQNRNGIRHTLEDLLAVLGDRVIEIRGTRKSAFSTAATIDLANSEALTFCKYTGDLANKLISASRASIVICGELDADKSFSSEKS